MNIKFLSLAVAAAFTLVGCGGGGGGESSSSKDSGIVVPAVQPPVENKNTNPGSVDAPFVAGAKPRFLMTGRLGQMSGIASPLTQTSDGAVTVMGSTTLTGTTIATQDISGNASFAQGRWSVGTAKFASSTLTMTGDSFDAFHYSVYNSLETFPTNGSMTCNSGKFTRPGYSGGTVRSTDNFGTSTGSASVTFDGAGANVSLVIATTGAGASGTVNLSGTVKTGNATYISGGLGGTGNGGMVAVGDAGNGAVNVIAIYNVVVANENKTSYSGIATFTCK
ncbi:MAG TPA: hypothetical protein VGD52_04385 [Pseudoduganella sp.]